MKNDKEISRNHSQSNCFGQMTTKSWQVKGKASKSHKTLNGMKHHNELSTSRLQQNASVRNDVPKFKTWSNLSLLCRSYETYVLQNMVKFPPCCLCWKFWGNGHPNSFLSGKWKFSFPFNSQRKLSVSPKIFHAEMLMGNILAVNTNTSAFLLYLVNVCTDFNSRFSQSIYTFSLFTSVSVATLCLICLLMNAPLY